MRSKMEISKLTTNLSVALSEVFKLKITDNKRIRFRTISLSKISILKL